MLCKLLWTIVVATELAASSSHKKCGKVTPTPAVQPCKVLTAVPWNITTGEAIPCSGSVGNEAECVSQGCCWHANSCYKKPAKCYVDFRTERCPKRGGWKESSIYTGYSLNGKYCFIETIAAYLAHSKFYGAASLKGVRILGPGDTNSCVFRQETRTWKIPSVPGVCTIEVRTDDKNGSRNGTIWANKCVLTDGNGQDNGQVMVYEFGHRNSCFCEVDSWLEDESDDTGVSENIREFVQKEELKSSCTRILGRILRKSWRNRIEVVNGAEASVVVSALVNITTKETKFISVGDAEVLLETSQQISKYKFFDGLDNHSADELIKSSTKYVSNLMKHVMDSNGNHPRLSRPKRSTDSSSSSGDSSEKDLNSSLIQWKIMDNLEKIVENVASLINIPENASRYIIEAKEDTVDLRVAIAKPENLKHLIDFSEKSLTKSSNLLRNAHVTDFSSYTGNDNVAVIASYYDIPSKEITTNATRESGVLAINPRMVNNGMIDGSLSLPVVFSMPKGNRSCIDGDCEFLCSYHEGRTEKFSGKWSQTGCKVNHTGEDFVTCQCNHTTHFAVLLMITPEEKQSQRDVSILEYLSIVLGSISVAALAVTVIVFISYRRILLKDRMIIHLHMIIALLGGYVSFLLGSIFSSRHLNLSDACFAFVITSHLFFLSTFFWFLMEGIYLFYKVVMVFSNKWGECGARYAPVFGWGAPTLVVTISVVASRYMNDEGGAEGYDAYYDHYTCFLQHRNGMIWTLVGPALCVITINLFVLVKVIYVIAQSSKTSSTKNKATKKQVITDSIKASTKGVIILLPILGVPWIASLFASLPPPSGIVASYVHVVLMGLQGVAIFLFYCVFNSEVRSAFKLAAGRRKSLASLEMTTNKGRKKSQAPLLATNGDSLSENRYKNSLTVSTTGRTYTATSQLSALNTPPPAQSVGDGMPYLSVLKEDSC